jgi:hypothetical protein
MIDVVGAVRIQVAEGIVGDRGQVDHGLEAAQVLDRDVADVAPQRARRAVIGTEVAALEQQAVEPDHLVAGRLEHGMEDGADVAVVAGQEDLHVNAPLRAWNGAGVRAPRATTHRTRPLPAGGVAGNASRVTGEGAFW